MLKYYYQKQKKNKKAKLIYNKLSVIDTMMRDYLLKIYYEKCKLEFSVAFFERKGEN